MTNLSYKIPDKALSYILFQRTAYIGTTNTLAYRAIRKFFGDRFYKPAVHLDTIIRSKKIKAAYTQDMINEYENIKSHLPETCNFLIDIGCGIAGIDLLLSRHYESKADLYLLDKSKMEDNVYYLFKEKGAFYNSLELAKDFLIENDVPGNKVHLIEATEQNDINVPGQVDLILSLISWGFHYPVWTYLSQAHSKLAKGGTLIIDVRKDTGGLEEVKAKFGDLEIIDETVTRQRIVARKS